MHGVISDLFMFSEKQFNGIEPYLTVFVCE